ncbi:MATE family efflux transporter [Diplocloster hominis]|uniref:MATE family efflux transporter n=1 Tax=Diplocloster hominis TaxID=3079010 RepID=UPI0031BA2EBD
MAKSMTKDMTVGTPYRLILRFTLPILCGSLFQQLYNMADAVIVGRYLGIRALSSVGASSSLIFLIIGFCTGMCTGFAIPAAQSLGAGKLSQMRKFAFNSFYLSGIFAVVITVVTAVFCRDILILIRTPESILKGAWDYLFVIFLGIPFTILYNLLASILRALGDSKSPFLFLTAAAVINIGLDLLFITVFDWGVMGAAIATITSQAVSGVLCIQCIVRKFPELKADSEERKPAKRHMLKLLNLGLPMGLQTSITAIGSIMLQSAVNHLGEVSVASYTAALKIKYLFLSVFEAVGTAMATYVGQNLGAGRLDRIREGVRSAILIQCIYAVAAAIVLHLGGRYIAMLFVDGAETEVLDNVQMFLNISSMFYITLGVLWVLRSAIQGMGYGKSAIFSGVSEMVARTAMSLFFIPQMMFLGVCWTDQIAWMAADLFLIPAYLFIMYRRGGFRKKIPAAQNGKVPADGKK